MKLDLDLVRQILLELEEKGAKKFSGGIDELHADRLRVPNRTEEEIGFHCDAMLDGGFIAGDRIDSEYIFVERITWKGHEFLQLGRNSAWFEFAKRQAMEQGLPAMWTIVVEYLKRRVNGDAPDSGSA